MKRGGPTSQTSLPSFGNKSNKKGSKTKKKNTPTSDPPRRVESQVGPIRINAAKKKKGWWLQQHQGEQKKLEEAKLRAPVDRRMDGRKHPLERPTITTTARVKFLATFLRGWVGQKASHWGQQREKKKCWPTGEYVEVFGHGVNFLFKRNISWTEKKIM